MEKPIRPCLTCRKETMHVDGAIELGNGQRYCADCKATRPRIVTPQVPTKRRTPS